LVWREMIKTQTKRIKRWFRNWWIWVAVGGILAVLAFPHLASAYHLEAGGRALDDSELLPRNIASALDIYKKPSNGIPTTPRLIAC